MAVWPFFKLWNGCQPTLFQMTFVSALLATVLGDCGPPPKLSFAFPINMVNETSFKTGTTLKYQCRLGYGRSSSSTHLTCDIGGVWSYSTFCIRKRCRNPGEIPNGQVEIKTDLSYGSHIEFRCLEGYILLGSTTSYCEVQERGVDWSDPLPICTSIHCEPPPAISHGRHSGREEDFYTYGFSVTYSCDSQYALLGQASISCSVENQTGVWSPDPPTCIKVTCPQPVVPNGIVSSGLRPTYTFKDSVVFSCKNGHILRGSRTIQCEEDNSWHPAPPTCELNSCTNLPDIPHANWEVYNYYKPRKESLYDVGTVLRYRCHSGYRSMADAPMTITCQEDLTWTPFKGCEKVCCPKPQLKNGKTTFKRIGHSTAPCDFFFGDQLGYSCEGSLRQFEATCQADGTWSPLTPTCDDNCNFPPNIAHGRHQLISNFFKTEALYECDDGYTLQGRAKISCSSSTWSSPLPQCKAQCLKPTVENGHLSVEKYIYYEGENITVHCNHGYNVVGTQSISCSENRTWYPEVFKCEWEVPEGCEAVLASQHLLKCLPHPEEVKLALEVYKLSLEIKKLERETSNANTCPRDSSL
ncbi:C4b-binding protein alpha chain [Echinops telfairi]|uniref:C4b-binding protein alpha chain n=1 Tax=Echinops telfairi TaxID=9371 RepID=A0ABM0ZPR6_ECHTE|nr:C4b-binding protein alpha chain [Echinops telfairi]